MNVWLEPNRHAERDGPSSLSELLLRKTARKAHGDRDDAYPIPKAKIPQAHKTLRDFSALRPAQH